MRREAAFGLHREFNFVADNFPLIAMDSFLYGPRAYIFRRFGNKTQGIARDLAFQNTVHAAGKRRAAVKLPAATGEIKAFLIIGVGPVIAYLSLPESVDGRPLLSVLKYVQQISGGAGKARQADYQGADDYQ